MEKKPTQRAENTVSIGIRIGEPLARKLRLVAAQRMQSMSAVVAGLIRDLCDDQATPSMAKKSQ